MKNVICFAMLWLPLFAAGGERLLQRIDWTQAAGSGQLMAGEVLTNGPVPFLRLVHTNDQAWSVGFLRLDNPGIQQPFYVLRGEVKYEGVTGKGYLESWNYFPPSREGAPPDRYFTRTLGESGEMGVLTGSSDWRRFVLPFNSTGAGNQPTKVELYLNLEGRGEVQLRNLEMVEMVPAGGTVRTGWWSGRTGGLIGGTAGAIVGLIAGISGWLVSRGRGRGFVLVSSAGLIAVGGLCGVVGVLAIALRQPYEVWFPFALLAILILCIMPARLKAFRVHYQELELRRMRSLDARG